MTEWVETVDDVEGKNGSTRPAEIRKITTLRVYKNLEREREVRAQLDRINFHLEGLAPGHISKLYALLDMGCFDAPAWQYSQAPHERSL